MKEEDVVLYKGVIFRRKTIPNPRGWADSNGGKVFPCKFCPFRYKNPYNKSMGRRDITIPMCKFIFLEEFTISDLCWDMNVKPTGESILLENGYFMIPTLKYIPPSKPYK